MKLHRGKRLWAYAALAAMAANTAIPAIAASPGPNDSKTATPIKHVIIIVGENRSFDHLFATYVPPKGKGTVMNMLSEGIIKADGKPGPHAAIAKQYSAVDHGTYSIGPGGKIPYTTGAQNMPPIMT